jgi:hypothetical protein
MCARAGLPPPFIPIREMKINYECVTHILPLISVPPCCVISPLSAPSPKGAGRLAPKGTGNWRTPTACHLRHDDQHGIISLTSGLVVKQVHKFCAGYRMRDVQLNHGQRVHRPGSGIRHQVIRSGADSDSCDKVAPVLLAEVVGGEV